MANTPLEHQEIVRLLSELKEETPEYPIHMMSERKAAFLKKVVDIKISGEDRSGKGGQTGGTGGTGRSGGSGGGLNSRAFAGISLKKTILIGTIIVILTTAYLFRDQVTDILVEKQITSVEETAGPSIAPRPADLATKTPAAPQNFRVTPTALGENPIIVESPSDDGAGGAGASGGQGPGQEPGIHSSSGRKGISGELRYLICVLQFRGDECR